jgi:N12 class adenine-specific DNA methylase
VANTDFDPDAYLNAVPQAAGAFDPDKYLAAPATGPKPNPDMLPQPAGDDVQPLPAGATESDRRRRDIAALATQQPYRNSVFGTAGALTPEEAQAERAKRIAEAQDSSAAATEERRRLAAQQATADAMGPANIKRGRANYSPNPVPSAIKEEEAAEAAAKTARDAPLPTMTAGRQAADRFTSSVLDGVRTGVRGMLELSGASNSLENVGKVGAGRTEQSAIDRASEATKNWIAEAFPADKAREKDFWTSQLPQGAGSSVPFLVAGLAARAVGAGDSVMTGIMAATGAGQQAGSEVEAFDEAIKKRRSVLDGLLKAKTPDEFRDQFFEEKDALRKALGPEEYNRVARIVAGHDPVAMQQVMQQLQVTRAGLDSVALKRMAVLFANAGIGTTEALPISNALERMNALSGGAVARIAKAGAANSFEEFVQEVGQQLGQNFVQGVVYDKAQDIYEGAADAGKVAAMVGLFQGGGMQAFHEAMNIGRSSGSLPLPGTVPPLLNPQDQANELRDILGEPRVEPPPGAAPVTADSRSILSEDPESRRPDDTDVRPDQESYVGEAMRNLRATSRTAKGVLDLSSTPGKEDQMTGVSAKHAATLAQENFEGVIRNIYDRLDEMPQDGPSMAAFIDSTAEAVNQGIVKPGKIMREHDTKIPAQTAALDLPAAHAQFSQELAERLADPNADPVETAAWIEWRANTIDHFWSDGVGKTSKALAAIPLMRAGLPLPNYPSSKEFFSYSPTDRVDLSGGGEAYLGPAWDRFNAFYHTLVGKPEPQQRAELKSMLENPATPLNDIITHPMVRRARDINQAAASTGTPENFADPAWRQARVYDFGGERVHGWDEAVERLTDQAKSFSTAEPVEQGNHAVIVLGPPAAGKSSISEPLARALRAAIVDADEAKKVIPEYRNGLGSHASHEESSELAKGVFKNLARNGSNIILPKVGHSYESIKGLVDVLKSLGYRVDIAHVAATPEISHRRNIARFLETGRLVDPDHITSVGDKPRNTAYMLKGDANDFIDADTSKGFEIVDGSGPLADAIRARRNVGWSPDKGRAGNLEGTGRGAQPDLIGEPVPGMQVHRVTDADGRSVEVAPVVVEAGSLRTSRDYGYDQELQPRDRDRAASDAQIREIENKLDPERLGYSSEADRGSPIVGSDRMVESGNGRVIALRNLYDKKRPQANAYRDWLRRQGVNVDAYQHPVLVRQRLTALTPKERQDFTLAANRPATLAMSAPEIAVSDAKHMNARMLGLIKNPDDLGSPANSGFFRSFLSLLPKSEHGTLADSKGHLSSVGLTRARNAILAKAYGDSDVLARIAESTNDDVKSISNALTAAAPAWAAMRADVEAGHVRADMDITPALVRAVERTAEIRSRGEKLDTFLAQQDAFDRLPAEVEGFMRMFYDPQGRRAASARRITDALRFVANEASKVSAEKSLGLDLIPVEPQDIQRLAREREWQDVEQGLSEPGRSPGDGARDEASGRQARGPWLSAGSEIAAQRGDEVDPVEEAIRAQRPTLDELRGPARVTEKTRAGDQFVFPGGERISSAELARRRAAEPLKPRAVQKATDFGLFGETAPQGDLLAPKKKSGEVSSFSDIRALLEQYQQVFVRWSASQKHDMTPGARSRDYQSGTDHAGLSALAIDRDFSDDQIFRFLRDYGYLRSKGNEGAKPRIYAGNVVGKDSDGADSIVPRQYLGTLSDDFIRFIDDDTNRERMTLAEDIATGKRALDIYKKEPPKYIPTWTPERVAKLEARLAELGGPVGMPGAPLNPANVAPTITAEETGDGRPGIQPSAPQVPGRTQARRLAKTPAVRPQELPLFGWQPSGGQVRDADVPVRSEPGGQEPPVHGEGPSVTKPPTRGGRNRSGRTDLPAVKGRLEAEKKIAERSRSNYRITPEDQVGVGNARQKINGNIAAIRTLKAIQEENRFATPEEKAILVRYVGWGAFAQDMFATHKPEWKNERDAFRALVSDDEYNSARESTLNAHFTSPDVIRGMWDAMAHLGFKGGQAIEPAAGVGHFIGLIPDKVASKTAWTAVELDPLTGGIAKALYGGSDVAIHGFEDLKRPSNHYDLAISNVPFGQYHISEKPYGSFPIHDFFFVKSLDKVRPGGVVAFITSRYTMDRVDPETRRLLGQSADLVGAIRLPGGRKGAFAGNAGTEVTTDIIFLRKKVPGEPAFPGANWSELKEIKTPEGPVQINEYFADRPEMMLGEMRLQGSMYQANEPVLVGDPEGIQQRIAAAARKMPEGALLPMESPPPPPINANEIGAGIKDGSFFLQNGNLYQRRQGQGFENPINPEDHDRLARLIGMRGIINDLLQTQLDAGENAKARSDQLRGELRRAYDAFVDTHGPINKEIRTVTNRLDKQGEPVVIVRHPNLALFRKDPDAWKVAAIEDYDSETGKTKRAAIQTKDVIDPPKERQINGPSDALSASLNDTAGVDLDHIAQSLNLDSHDAVVEALGNLVFQNPNGRKWETADEYLSGNVVKKLEDARVLAETDPTYLRNVSALEKVQPEPLTGTDITAQFGAPWIPGEVYQDFLKEIGIHNPRVAQVPITGEWKFDYAYASNDAQVKYGTSRVDVGKIANAAINNKMVTVYDRAGEDKSVVNETATQEARVKTELLKEAFTGDLEHGIDGWVFADPERAQLLEGIYNRTYNNLAQRQFDGFHLTLPGLNPNFSTRKHRRDAIWRIIQSGNTLLAHVVGSGKTVTMIAAGMEEKRLGLINKPAYVVPNHMLEQFSREFLQAYPNAKILVAQKDEMTRNHRKEFLAKVAANDWDGVIITHDAFGRINMGKEFRRSFIQDQLDELERVMRAESAGDKKSPTIKNLEKVKKKLKERLQNLMNEERKDEGTSFEESGIDRLYIDEAHKFKNLQFITRFQRVAGLAQDNSQRAEDLFLKIRYLEQKRPGRSAVFATGTPVSNTMAELWTMMRYLELDKLRERGLETFDAWASTFGRVVNNMELSADGRAFKEKASFSKFVNIPELIALYSEVADTKTADMLNLPRPEVKTRSGAPGIEIVEATPSSQEEEHINSLVALAESLKGKPPRKGEPNMLSVVTAGRKVATDGRLISSDFDFNPRGKIALAVGNIARIYQEGNKDPAAPNKVQMVFLDMGVPQSRSAKKRVVESEDDSIPTQQDRIDLYADLKQRLVDQGIPAREIAAIHDASDDIKKAKLFKRVRSGEIRVILGSSEKMGVGTNVQDLLIAMHHLDAPWKPAEVEQRDGRIVRQGNHNKTVQIYRYVTKKSFDAFMWQKLDTKARFIGQVLSGAKGSRHAEDIDNPLPEAAEMKAAASGDPRIMEHAELDRIVRSLSAQRRAFDSTKSRANSGAAQAKSRIEMYEKALPNAKADAAAVQDISGDKFSVELGDAGTFTNRAEAGKAILDRLAGINAQSFYKPKVFTIGSMSGLTMNMEVRGGWDGTQAVVRAIPSLKGKSGYGAANDTVINEHTDPAGLIRRFENILANIRTNPERLTRELTNEKESLGKLQRTLSGEWPREKEYRAALQKLDDLTKAMKAPEHPDVVEAQNDEVKAQAPERQIETAAFKKWFGDSKVVDENGKPKIVYHGTNHVIEAFSPEKLGTKTNAGTANLGFFFTDNPLVAATFARGEGGNTVPAYLSLKNPLEIGDRSAAERRRNSKDAYDALHDAIVKTSGKPSWNEVTVQDIGIWRQKVIDAGFDGLVLRKTAMDAAPRSINDPYSDHLVAFHPEQIKSAIGNRGTFDQTDPDIRANKPDARKEFLTFKDKPTWAVVVDPIDSAILHSVRYKHAADNNFNHSQYMPERFARMVSDGGAILAWADDRGVHAMEPLSPQMQEAVERLYDGPTAARTPNEPPIPSDLGPQPGETVVKIGRGTVAHIKPTDRYTKAEQKIAAVVQEIGNRMAPQADVQGTAALRMRGEQIWGAFVNSKAFPHLIAWSLEKGSAGQVAQTVRHEIVHHLREAGLIRPDEWAALHDAAVKGDWLGKHDIDVRYPHLSRDRKIEEAIAEEFSYWRTDRAVIKGFKDPVKRLIMGAFNRIDLLLRRIAAAARKFLGRDATVSDIFTRMETGEVGRREKAGEGRGGKVTVDTTYDIRSGAVASKDPNGPVFIDRRIPQFSPTLKARDGGPAHLWKYLAIHETEERAAMAKGMPYEKAHETVATPAERTAVEDDGVDWKAYTREMDGYLAAIEHEPVKNPPPNPHVDPNVAVGKPHHHSANKAAREAQLQKPDRLSAEERERLRLLANKSMLKPLSKREAVEFEALRVKNIAERTGTTLTLDGIMPFYRRVVERTGGLSTVRISDLQKVLGVQIEELHSFLKREARNGNITLHVGETPWGRLPEDAKQAAIRFPGEKDPFVSLTILDDDIRAQTPGREARERRQAAAVPARTIWQRVVQSSDNFRAAADAYADSIGVNEIIRGLQMKAVPMAARDASVEARVITKEYMNWYRQSRHDWNNVDKRIMDNFPADRRRAMWEAADEQSVAMQQGLPTAGIGLDRLPANERAVVDVLQNRGASNFAEARSLKMIQTAGLPSYAPRMLVRMSNGEAEIGAGAGSEIVKDIRTLALANARLEQAIAARKMINAIEDVGRRSGTATVNSGGAPSNRVGADGVVAHALDQMGVGFATTTPQLRHRKHLTAAETEAAANLVRTPPPDAPKWFTLNNPAFMRLEPRLVVNATTGRFEIVKDPNGDPVFDRKPIYVRSDFEGPLRAVLSKDSDKLYQLLMALKGKAMSVIMMSPLIHNQVEWGRALPAAPGKVLSFQVYLEGNRVANDPARMRLAISGGTSPIGGHGFMQDLVSIAEAPTLRPGSSITAKGLGYAAEATGHISRLFNPRAGADQVRRAVDYMGNIWHNTLLWDRIRDLQMGLWSHIYEKLVAKGYNPYAANVAASHFANRYAGALPLESMSGAARGIANILLFSRTFTLGNLGAFKDAALGLPRDAQALVQHHAGWDELQKIQSFVRRKSLAMLAIDAGLYYATLSALQSAFNVAGVVPSVTTLGGMIAGGALGGRFGKYGGLATAVAGGAVGFGLAAVLGASPGTKKLEDELEGYWERFADLMHRLVEHPFNVVTHPIMLLESLSSTSENEPGKRGRILVGYQPDGTAIYARLAVGKVTEELIGWVSSANEMLHNKLSTFARPLNEIWSNDAGFGHKLYNPKAETYTEQAKNAIKIGAAIVGSQIPLDTIKGAIEWAQGGPGSDVAGLKAIAPFIGTTISKGYPGGPASGVLNAARERIRFERERMDADHSQANPQRRDRQGGREDDGTRHVSWDAAIPHRDHAKPEGAADQEPGRRISCATPRQRRKRSSRQPRGWAPAKLAPRAALWRHGPMEDRCWPGRTGGGSMPRISTTSRPRRKSRPAITPRTTSTSSAST